MNVSKKYTAKRSQVLALHERIVYVDLDNFNRREHILTARVRFSGLLSGCPKSKVVLGPSEAEKGKAVCAPRAPGKPRQPPAHSLPGWDKAAHSNDTV